MSFDIFDLFRAVTLTLALVGAIGFIIAWFASTLLDWRNLPDWVPVTGALGLILLVIAIILWVFCGVVAVIVWLWGVVFS